jgi:hypothetical protein
MYGVTIKKGPGRGRSERGQANEKIKFNQSPAADNRILQEKRERQHPSLEADRGGFTTGRRVDSCQVDSCSGYRTPSQNTGE